MVINNLNKIVNNKNIEIQPAPASVPERSNFNRPEKPEAPLVEKIAENMENQPAPSERLGPVAPANQAGRPAIPEAPPTAPVVKIDDNYRKIEFILEEDLEDIYLKMSSLEQQRFKNKGEETTLAIIRLLAKPQIQLKKIIDLIREWLKLLVGINRFFLEQMAKIKADKILAEARHRRS